jgi:hypothetical protein
LRSAGFAFQRIWTVQGVEYEFSVSGFSWQITSLSVPSKVVASGALAPWASGLARSIARLIRAGRILVGQFSFQERQRLAVSCICELNVLLLCVVVLLQSNQCIDQCFVCGLQKCMTVVTLSDTGVDMSIVLDITTNPTSQQR